MNFQLYNLIARRWKLPMPDLKRPLKVFLSYASQDKPLVRELSRRLVGEGWIDTWQDEKNLLPGQDWRVKIEEAVEDADVVIIVLSQHSVTKEGNVQKELRYAREIALEKPEDAIFLIPLRLDECEVPRGLRFYQWVDYFDDNKDSSYKALVASLNLRYEQKIKSEEAERLRKEQQEREIAENIARERAERDAAKKARLVVEELARQKATKEKATKEKAEYETAEREKAEFEAIEKEEIYETYKKMLHSLFRKKRIIIPVTAILFLCVMIFAVFPVITKSDISSTPIAQGISEISIPPFSTGEDVYIYFNLDQVPSGQKFASRWFLKVKILWTDLYIPIGYLEYFPSGRESHLFFHLKNPGIIGEYRVDIYMDKNIVGTKTFVIYPKE